MCVGRRRLRDERATREEGRDGVGEDDLRRDAVGFEVALATVGVPVAFAEIAQEVGISQMHVSRLLARTLTGLRAQLVDSASQS